MLIGSPVVLTNERIRERQTSGPKIGGLQEVEIGAKPVPDVPPSTVVLVSIIVRGANFPTAAREAVRRPLSTSSFLTSAQPSKIESAICIINQ